MKNTTMAFHVLWNIPDTIHWGKRGHLQRNIGGFHKGVYSISRSGYQDSDHLKIYKASDLPFLLTYFLIFFILPLPLLSLLFI